MKDLSHLMQEVDQVLLICSKETKAIVLKEGWDSQRSLFLRAYMTEKFGREFVTKDKFTVSSNKAKIALESMMPIPESILGMPVQDSEGIWWKAVADSIENRVLIDKSGIPVIGSVLDGYLRYLEDMGIKPTMTKMVELEESIESLGIDVKKNVSRLSETTHVDRSILEYVIKAR